MVLLTMTKRMVEGLEKIQSRKEEIGKASLPCDVNNDRPEIAVQHGEKDQLQTPGNGVEVKDDEEQAEDDSRVRYDHMNVESGDKHTEPSLEVPRLGAPISHGQVIDISTELKAAGVSTCSLEKLLQGARLYVPPPPPKKEPTSQYKALMARLRGEEELRAYERMTNPSALTETFNQRFPASSAAHAFSSNQPIGKSGQDDDEVTYADVDRQMALIFNVLISIVACAGAIWVVARWWSTPARLAVSMGGSLLVGIAEVVVYSGYIRRVAESKGKARNMREVKEVVNTWVIGGGASDDDPDNPTILVSGTNDIANSNPRRRIESGPMA